MKKYLMMSAAALALSAAFVSCSKETTFSAPATTAEQDSYNKVFLSYVGSISPNQDWGFSENQVTRGCYTDGNLWEDKGYTLPADITAEEIAKVKAVFAQKGEASYTSLIDLDCYFVQQVYCGDSVYTAGNGGKVTGAQHMDKLVTVETKDVVVKCWYPYEEEVVTVEPHDVHINNFNNASCPDSWVSEKTGTAVKELMLMINSNTNIFGFISSEDSQVHYNFRMEEIDGNYYVGFDFEASGANPNQQVPRDYVYDDWIVKIVPGKGVTPPAQNLRIIAEDLSASAASDFDFNDVVLDVEMGTPAKVKLIAAGGTLPIRINENDEWEIHKLLGHADAKENGKLSMINTGALADYNDVPAVYVPNFNESITSAAEANTKIKLEVYKNGKWQELTAPKGEPSCKLAVDTTFKILGERQSIKEEYDYFVDWADGTGFLSKWWK